MRVEKLTRNYYLTKDGVIHFYIQKQGLYAFLLENFLFSINSIYYRQWQQQP